MTLFSDAKGRKVVSITTAATLGKVSDYIVDPHTSQIAALILKRTGSNEETLPWVNIAAFGDDAVTVKAETAIVDANDRIAELADKSHAMHGKRVLTTDGQQLGDVKDIDFDPETGTLNTLVVKGSDVSGDRLRSVGSYAVIVET